MSNFLSLTSAQLKRATAIKDKVAIIEKALASVQGSAFKKPASFRTPKKKSKMSAAARARIVAAQKARWARFRARREQFLVSLRN